MCQSRGVPKLVTFSFWLPPGLLNPSPKRFCRQNTRQTSGLQLHPLEPVEHLLQHLCPNRDLLTFRVSLFRPPCLVVPFLLQQKTKQNTFFPFGRHSRWFPNRIDFLTCRFPFSAIPRVQKTIDRLLPCAEVLEDTSQFFPGILPFRKPSEPQRKKESWFLKRSTV